MIDAIRMDESELPDEENKFGTRSKHGTIADRQTRFLTFDKRVPVIAAIALIFTLAGWVASAAGMIYDAKADHADIVMLKQANKDIVAKEAVRDEVDARIDERTKMTQDTVGRIEKYLMSRGK